MSKQKLWLVDFPLSQYNEDVVTLAKEAKLTVTDSRFARKVDQALVAKRTPKLTKVGETQKTSKE